MQLPPPPSEAVVPCSPLTKLTTLSKGEVLVWIKETSKAYAECNNKRQTLVDAWPE